MTSYLDWHVGMKVLFLGYDQCRPTGAPTMKPGQIFTIKAIKAFDEGTIGVGDDGSKFRLKEGGVYIQVDDRRSWCVASGFRPVQPRATDISIFTEMLVSTPKVEELGPVVFSDQEPS